MPNFRTIAFVCFRKRALMHALVNRQLYVSLFGLLPPHKAQFCVFSKNSCCIVIRRLAHLAAQVRSVVAPIGHCLGYTTPVRDPPGDDSLAFRFFFFFRFAEKEKKAALRAAAAYGRRKASKKTPIYHLLSFTCHFAVIQLSLFGQCCHFLSFAVICCHLLSFAVICCQS